MLEYITANVIDALYKSTKRDKSTFVGYNTLNDMVPLFFNHIFINWRAPMETYSSAIVSVPTQQIANFLWYIEKNIYF